MTTAQRSVAPEPIPDITPGTVLYLADDRDYRYGVGPVALVVDRLAISLDRVPPGIEWLTVAGRRLTHDGLVHTRELTLTLRVTALAGAVRPTGWLPPAAAEPKPITRSPIPLAECAREGQSASPSVLPRRGAGQHR